MNARQEMKGAQAGSNLRKTVPRRSLGVWDPPQDRSDPVDVITAQNEDRVEPLVPIRHYRMAQSPFAFYRGAAAVMAMDLAGTQVTGITAQICGDAHLSNFGGYGAPDRALVFDVNDFDETLPGPWEWDVKRLTTSLAVAARYRGHGEGKQADVATRAAAAYQKAMGEFAGMRYLDVWYSRLDVDDLFEALRDQLTKKQRKRGEAFVRKARTKDSVHAVKKLAEEVDGRYRIVNQEPLIVPLRDFPLSYGPEEVAASMQASFEQYLDSVPDDLEVLLRRFRYSDFALKVVGVGSVGTRCFILLLEGRDAQDPFFLQIKEATRSVLEAYLDDSRYDHHGRRVVEGQRLMQASSDSFLGWLRSDEFGKDYYVRQFKDMKASVDIDRQSLDALSRYGGLCGWTLARAHARSSDAAAIAGYMGSGKQFSGAMADFSVAYADQNERDYTAFKKAVDTGRIPSAAEAAS